MSMLLIAALVAEDQLIKLYIVRNFEITSSSRSFATLEIGDFRICSITHIRNNGAGWSILGGKTVFLVVFTSVVLAAILVYVFLRRNKISKLELLSLSMIVAGGLGNLVDRLRMLIEGTDVFPGVIDYIRLDFIDFPVFNFADCCVTVGAVLFCIEILIEEIRSSKAKKAAKISEKPEDAEIDSENEDA